MSYWDPLARSDNAADYDRHTTAKNSYIRYKGTWMTKPLEAGPYFAHEVESHRQDIEGFEGIEWTKVFTK